MLAPAINYISCIVKFSQTLLTSPIYVIWTLIHTLNIVCLIFISESCKIQINREIHPYIIHYIRAIQIISIWISVWEINCVLCKHRLVQACIIRERTLIETHHYKTLRWTWLRCAWQWENCRDTGYNKSLILKDSSRILWHFHQCEIENISCLSESSPVDDCLTFTHLGFIILDVISDIFSYI